MDEKYQVVQLQNGAHSVRSVAHGETFHPVVGPVAEAEGLYLRQLRLLERLEEAKAEFVIWDVGLGAAANPLTLVTAASHLPRKLCIVSFDCTREPLLFALEHADKLPYLSGFSDQLKVLARKQFVQFQMDGRLDVNWELHLHDFPSLLRTDLVAGIRKPDAIFYDAFSPVKNPAMWTLQVFSDLFRLLDPKRPCTMPTYSRSTLLRVTLLLAGFYVGVGHATGEKEETTIAANRADLLSDPLTSKWLARVRRSRSAEPLHSPEYRQAPMCAETLHRLIDHPQFQ